MMGGGGGGLILLLVVLGLVVFVLIKVFPDWQDRVGLSSRRREDSAEETLRQRFARGEIDQEEYEERRRILREESPAAHR
jgi:putative membrane protein